jgi:hypothetical protein
VSTTGNGAFPLPPDDVILAVAAAYQLNPRDLTGGNRRWPRPEARLVLYQLLHDECHLSWGGVADTMNRVRGGWIAAQARKADPAALAELRTQLRPNGNQEQLFR